MASLTTEYTSALFTAAQALNIIEPAMSDLRAVREVVMSCKGVFFNPSIPAHRLTAFLQESLAGRIQPLVWEFVSLLLAKRLLKWLPAIDKQYQALVEKWLGHVAVHLRMPFAPEAALLQKLSLFLAAQGMFREEQCGKVQFEVLVQPDLLGGFIAEYDNRVLDVSFKTQLQVLRAGTKNL